MDINTAKANIGKMVYVSDGTTKPPKHHSKKVREWERANYSGILKEVNEYPDICAHRSIMTQNHSHFVMNQGGTVESMELGEHPLAPAHETVCLTSEQA